MSAVESLQPPCVAICWMSFSASSFGSDEFVEAATGEAEGAGGGVDELQALHSSVATTANQTKAKFFFIVTINFSSSKFHRTYLMIRA